MGAELSAGRARRHCGAGPRRLCGGHHPGALGRADARRRPAPGWTVDLRGQWGRVLPRFSELSLWCVLALLTGGVVGALAVLDSAVQLIATGYGHLLLVKIGLTVVLMILAWRNRARWLPAA